MATLTETAAKQDQRNPASQDQQVVLHGVSWETYEGLLRSDESQRGSVRMSYDRGRLVLMSPSQEHEQGAERLGLLVRLAAAVLGRELLGVGRMTLKRQEIGRGKEADTAFYLASEPLVRGKEIDLDVDPPPDLAIEVEITHHDQGMLAIDEALGVGEVWRFDGTTLRVLRLQPEEGYAEVAASVAMPEMPLKDLPRWLELAEVEGESAMLTAFLDWARRELAPGPASKRKRGKRP
jgi:Uma2 family endonuclease